MTGWLTRSARQGHAKESGWSKIIPREGEHAPARPAWIGATEYCMPRIQHPPERPLDQPRQCLLAIHAHVCSLTQILHVFKLVDGLACLAKPITPTGMSGGFDALLAFLIISPTRG